jgi:hypothetical protein
METTLPIPMQPPNDAKKTKIGDAPRVLGATSLPKDEKKFLKHLPRPKI